MNACGVRLRSAVACLSAAVALLAGLAGCGGVTSGQPAAGDPPASPGSSAPSYGTGDTVLTIVVDDGQGTVTTHRLTCTPVGGDHPDPEAACRALNEHGAEALPAVPSDRYCTQNIAGPHSATVTGLWRGQEIDSRFNLRNGCEIARWKSLDGLLPPVEG